MVDSDFKAALVDLSNRLFMFGVIQYDIQNLLGNNTFSSRFARKEKEAEKIVFNYEISCCSVYSCTLDVPST